MPTHAAFDDAVSPHNHIPFCVPFLFAGQNPPKSSWQDDHGSSSTFISSATYILFGKNHYRNRDALIVFLVAGFIVLTFAAKSARQT